MRPIHHAEDWTKQHWTEQHWTEEQEQRDADRQTRSLAGLALALALVVIALFLVRELQAKAALEDCLLAGHNDCGLFVPQPMLSQAG